MCSVMFGMLLYSSFLVSVAGYVNSKITSIPCPKNCPATKADDELRTCARIEPVLFPPTQLSCQACDFCGNLTLGDAELLQPARSLNFRKNLVPDDDSKLYCDECSSYYFGDCPVHGPFIIVENKQLPLDGSDPLRALKSSPDSVYIAESSIPGAGLGVFARQPIFKRTRFGPYEGVLTPNWTGAYAWKIVRPGQDFMAIDAEDPSLSNWLRLVNTASSDEQQNMVSFQYKGQIYYRAYKDISPGTELLIWYGKVYGILLGILPKEEGES